MLGGRVAKFPMAELISGQQSHGKKTELKAQREIRPHRKDGETSDEGGAVHSETACRNVYD